MIKDFFTGGSKRQQSLRTMDRLSKKLEKIKHRKKGKNELSQSEQKNLDDAIRVNRRHFLKLWWLSAIVAIDTALELNDVGLIIGWILPLLDENKEEKTQELINKAENGFQKFSEIALPLIDQASSEQLWKMLKVPFQVMQINKWNQDRNLEIFKEKMKSMENGSIYKLKNPNFYYYSVMENSIHSSWFEAITRILYLSEKLDPDNLLDLLVLYHEIYHASQDAATRSRINSKEQFQKYVDFHTVKKDEKPRIIINFELTAYAVEIELLNLLLDGKLKKSIIYKRQIDIEQIAKKLNAQDDQHKMIQSIVSFAKRYYPLGIQRWGFSREYWDFIIKHYRANWYEIYANYMN